jgi:hypothetical protein
VWPLTSNLSDTNGTNALAGLAANPTPIGASGFIGNGTNAKLSGVLPAWAQNAAADLALFARVRPPATVAAGLDVRETAVSVTNSTGTAPKLELCATVANVATVVRLRALSGGSAVEIDLARVGWRFERRVPEKIAGVPPPLQCVCFLDDNTLLFACKEPCALYRMNLTTGEITGRALSSLHTIINSMHRAPNGDVWFQCTAAATGFDEVRRLDVTATFASGVVTESGAWDTGDVPVSMVAFASAGGVDYVVLGATQSSGTPRAYVFPASAAGTPVSIAAAVRRFRIGLRVQDMAYRPFTGRLHLIRWGGVGFVEEYDFAAIMAGADDPAPAALSSFVAPSAFVEGLDFHPTTSRAYAGTEVNISAQADSFGAVWSSELSGTEENAIQATRVGTALEVQLNRRLLVDGAEATLSVPSTTPTRLAVGAPPNATAGGAGFLSSGGFVRAVALKSAAFSATDLDDLA